MCIKSTKTAQNGRVHGSPTPLVTVEMHTETFSAATFTLGTTRASSGP